MIYLYYAYIIGLFITVYKSLKSPDFKLVEKYFVIFLWLLWPLTWLLIAFDSIFLEDW